MVNKTKRQLNRNRRLRHLILAITVLCIGISVALNVMHAPNNVMARLVAGAPPIAAFFVIELIARIPASNKWLAAGRIFGSLVVGGVAGTISYLQQIDYLHSLGYEGWVAVAFPAVIDGTMLVTTLSLVEVVRTIRQLEDLEDAAPEVEASKVMETAIPESVTVADFKDLPNRPVSPAVGQRIPERTERRHRRGK